MKQVSTEKKIEDYLHLYLPVDVELDNGGSKVYNRTAVGVGNTDDEFRYVTLRMGVGKESFANSVLLSENRVKPILRPLSDMTEEEKTEIAKQWTWYEEMQIVGEQHFNIRHEINHQMVEKALDFTNEDDGDRMSPLAYYQVLPYLLKHGFDLFGLIESGLAIDKTKL